MSKKPATQTLPQKNSDTKPPEAELRAEIERQIGPLIGQGQRDQVVMRVMSIMASEQFSGPIAHPRHLAEYERILPGSAERIVQMAERAQSHNREMESKIVCASIDTEKRGAVMGFVTIAALVVLGTTVGLYGHIVLAGLLLGGGLLGGAATLIRGIKKE